MLSLLDLLIYFRAVNCRRGGRAAANAYLFPSYINKSYFYVMADFDGGMVACVYAAGENEHGIPSLANILVCAAQSMPTRRKSALSKFFPKGWLMEGKEMRVDIFYSPGEAIK